MSLKDLQLPPKMRTFREQLKSRIHDISQSPSLTHQQKNDQIVKILTSAMDKVQSKLVDEAADRGNGFALGVRNGLKGKPGQLMQLMFGDMINADHKGSPVPIPGIHGYGEGLTPTEFWAGSYASRRGYADVQFATARTGFLGKQLAGMAQRITVTGEDCGSGHLGIKSDGDDPDVLGSVLARDLNGIPSGTVLEKEHLSRIRGTQPLIRSVITCQQEEGVCQQCSGKQDQGRFPPLGAHIGITAARVVSEPMTQELGLSAKHTGGTLRGDEEITGFDEVNQFVQVPQNFKGASVLAPKDGIVQQIIKAPQGGHYVQVGPEQVYVPPNREIEVQKGDTVEAGDMLTDGTPNPAEIAVHKGLGAGRQYFNNKFYDILKKNGVGTSRKNIETLSRGFFNRVRITRPTGILGHNVDSIVPYSDIQREYKARADAQKQAPGRSVGRYLETPVLHYTVGTRITPRVAKAMQQEGVKTLTTHKNDPGFQPEVVRLMAHSATDPDWKVRMSGFGLKRSYLDAAQKGSTSKKDNTSYVPSLMDPLTL